MIVKNVSGGELHILLGLLNGLELANNATATVDDNPETVADAVKYANQGLLEITQGPASLELAQAPTIPAHIILTIKTAVADTATFVLNTTTFEIDTNATVTEGNTTVTKGANAATCAAAAKTAINADPTLQALGITVRDVINISTSENRLIITLPSTLTAAGVTATSSDGTNLVITKVEASTEKAQRKVSFTAACTAGEVTAGNKAIVTGLNSITHVSASLRTAAGVAKAWDGAIGLHGGSILLDNSGASDFAATDVFVVQASGF